MWLDFWKMTEKKCIIFRKVFSLLLILSSSHTAQDSSQQDSFSCFVQSSFKRFKEWGLQQFPRESMPLSNKPLNIIWLCSFSSHCSQINLKQRHFPPWCHKDHPAWTIRRAWTWIFGTIVQTSSAKGASPFTGSSNRLLLAVWTSHFASVCHWHPTASWGWFLYPL